MASGNAGLRAIDISDPFNSTETGFYITRGYVYDIATDGELIFVADSLFHSIYQYIDGWFVEGLAPGLPSEMKLFPSYPNPFNSTTTISYQVLTPGQLSLTVYTPTGQHISTLFEGYCTSGNHSTDMDANGLSTGLYFIRLNASGHVITQKVILIR